MKKLLKYIVDNILEDAEYSIEETKSKDQTDLVLKVKKDNMGIVIGKGGSTIKSIRNILKVRGALKNKLVNVSAEEAD